MHMIAPRPAEFSPVRRSLRFRLMRWLCAVGVLLVAWSAPIPLLAQDAPVRGGKFSTDTIGRDSVEGTLALTSSNLATLLNRTPGLRVQPTAPSLGGVNLRMRGLRGRYTLVLSDGLPLYGGQSVQRPLQIPAMDLGHVEVIEGAASARYGAGAVGGVVNLVSRQPDSERELVLNGTTLGGTDAVLWLADKRSANWGYTLSGAVHSQGQGDVDGDGWADVPEVRGLLLRPRLFWDDGRGRSLLATVGGMAENREGGTVEGALHPSGEAVFTEFRTRYADVGVVAQARTGGGRLFALRGSTSVQHHGHTYGDTPEDDRHTTVFAEASVTGTNGPHTWVFGTAFQHDVYRAEDLDGFDYTHSVPALFAQNQVTLARDLIVSGSARLDAHSKYGTFVSFRVSGLLRPDPWTVRASAGTGFFAPTPFMEETEAVGLSRVAPLRGVRAERARSASVDLGRKLGPLELNASLFASSIQDALAAIPADPRALLVGAPTAGGSVYAVINQVDPTRAWGGEMRVSYEKQRLHLAGTYVYTRATENAIECYRRAAIAELVGFPCEERSRREVPRTHRHAAGALVGWEDEHRGRVGIDLGYVGRQELEDDPSRTVSKGYVVLGVLLERHLSRARVFLKGDNLLDARQTRWSPLMRRLRSPQGRWTTDVWAPLEGRVFGAGVRWAL